MIQEPIKLIIFKTNSSFHQGLLLNSFFLIFCYIDWNSIYSTDLHSQCLWSTWFCHRSNVQSEGRGKRLSNYIDSSWNIPC